MDFDLALLQACGLFRQPSTGNTGSQSLGNTGSQSLGIRPVGGAAIGAGQATPSLALPIPGALATVQGLKRSPVTSVNELSEDVKAFFAHLRDSCPFFNNGTQDGIDSLQRIYKCMSDIFHGPHTVTDPDHIDYLSKALQYLRHSSFSNPNMGFGIQSNCPCPVAGEYARFFQPGETHATRAASVVEHLVQQSRYFYQTLRRPDYEQLNRVLVEYACDSGPINEAMKGSANASPAAIESARILLTVLQDPRMPGIKGPFTLYRGIGSMTWHDGGPERVSAPFFHSLTTDPEVMRRFAAKGQWLIHIPAGVEAKVVDMAQFLVRQENEIILGPSVLERVQQLSPGNSEEAPAYLYRYGGPAECRGRASTVLARTI